MDQYEMLIAGCVDDVPNHADIKKFPMDRGRCGRKTGRDAERAGQGREFQQVRVPGR